MPQTNAMKTAGKSFCLRTRSFHWKKFTHRLIEVSLKMGDVEEAEEFYNEFLEIAPNDNTKYILQYKIYKRKGRFFRSADLKILEEYKEREFTEKWTYELAKLYYKAGDKEKCLSLCDEMVLWFSEGSYVMKALDLKMRMGVLTGEEKEKYEKQFVPKLLAPEDAELLKEKKASEAPEEGFSEGPAIESIRIRSDKDLSDAETLQDKISKGFRDIFGSKKKEEEEESLQEEDPAEEIPEEMIKQTISKEEFAEIPQLEKEGAAPTPAAEMKMRN